MSRKNAIITGRKDVKESRNMQNNRRKGVTEKRRHFKWHNIERRTGSQRGDWTEKSPESQAGKGSQKGDEAEICTITK